MSFVRQNRRRFLRTLAGAGGAAGAASLLAQERSFRGSRAGETRVVDDVTLCWCPPGRFVMGSPPSEHGRRPDEAQVEVFLTRGFWTAQQEVTQRQWRQVVGNFPDQPPSAAFGEGDNFPAYWISGDEAEAFCAGLTRRGRRSGALPEAWEFRLPTEAQWEYACRAGTTSATPFGDTVGLHQANFAGELVDRALPSERARPTRGQLSAESVGNPRHARQRMGMVPGLVPHATARRHGSRFVRRAGRAEPRRHLFARPARERWIEEGWTCRSACRLRYEPHRRSDHIGFRVVAAER